MRSCDCHEVEVSLAILISWDIPDFKTMVSLCLRYQRIVRILVIVDGISGIIAWTLVSF